MYRDVLIGLAGVPHCMGYLAVWCVTNSIQLLQVKLICCLASMITPVSNQLCNSSFCGEANDVCGIMYTGNNNKASKQLP